MASAVRYQIVAQPVGYTGGRGSLGRTLQSGKLTSSGAGVRSTIVTVPDVPDGTEARLTVFSMYTDPVAKTGNGYSFFQATDPGTDPTPGVAEAAVDTVPRFVLQPPMPQGTITVNAPGFPGIELAVRPGQRFAIADTGWAV